MSAAQNLDQNAEIQKVRQLLAKNIDDFKYLVLYNMRLGESSGPSSEPAHVSVNRVSDFQEKKTETLEEWVAREFAPKPVQRREEPSFAYRGPNETLEQWVARQRIKSKSTKPAVTIMDTIEQWLMNEAKKDLFAEMDAIYGNPEIVSSEYVRELGLNLVSLADKLDRMQSRVQDSPRLRY